MPKMRRVNARDIAGGTLLELIARLIDDVRTGNMETKERSAMMLRSLTEQPKGLAGPQEHENAVLIAQKGAIRPLVSLVIIGNPNAQAHA